MLTANPAAIAAQPYTLNTIEEAIEDIRQGKIIIVVDDEDRENEGDFICAAQCITPDMINFMARYGRGLICTPIDETRADELDLPLMVADNTALHETAFTVSIDLIGHGCTTGISAYDRATGIRAMVNPAIKAQDFARPGHIFPLRARSGGVLRRTGHTEATVDLARMAGFFPAGVLVEILHEDGSMARLPQLFEIAREHDLKIISIDDLVAYRMRHERLVRRELTTTLDTRFGEMEVIVYQQLNTGDQHIVFKKGDWRRDEPILVKMYSASETGEILGMVLDGYGAQIEEAMHKIQAQGKGVVICLRHQAEQLSLLQRLKNYNAPKKEAQEQRDFGVGAQILNDLNIHKLRLMTKQPKKRIGLIGYNLEITSIEE